jgi:hypothetical protein
LVFQPGEGEKQTMLTVASETKPRRQTTRGFHLLEKLTSPSRQVSAEERLKRHEEKQAKANELRLSRLHGHKEKMDELKRKVCA